MRIQKIQLENIGVFENQTVEFLPCPAQDKAEIHIFTGNNGTGKSTLLKALVAGFGDVLHPENDDLVTCTDANNFKKYLREKNENSGAEISIEHHEKENIIKYIGCRAENHLHIEDDKNDPHIYRRELNFRRSERPIHIFDYVLFAYSGYRLIEFNGENSTKNKNPLFQSLEFVKGLNPNFSIENWIKSSVLKRSYAQSQNLDTKLKNYQQTIEKLEEAISEITGFSVKFKMDKNLRQAVIHYNEQEHDLEVLPDGLKSIISWLADLCMRLEDLDWVDDTPVFDRNIILFLDEIENHLHIKWQRKILPVVQKLLPNAQIFVTTHSPFIINSVDNAFVYKLSINPATNFSVVAPAKATNSGNSYITELLQILEVEEEYGLETQQKLDSFYKMVNQIRKNEAIDQAKFMALANELAAESDSLYADIHIQLRKLSKETQHAYAL
jgi:predicted ATP-binding protein involved in virulence